MPDRLRLQWPMILAFSGWVVALGSYKLAGFGPVVLTLFTASIGLVGWGLYRVEPKARHRSVMRLVDLLPVVLLLAIFLPLYLVQLYRLPYPIHNDEIRLMVLETKLTQPGTDWFGVSEYLSMPIFLFTLFGGLGKIAGGIELANMRAVHAAMGVLIVVVSYGFFRSAATHLIAFGAACIVGLNHSLWMLSRMALWDNSALLFQVIALAILIHGMRQKSPAIAFVGGVATGACFYVYLPARATLVIWGLFLAAVGFYFRDLIPRKRLTSLAVASLVGCLMTTLPLLITNTDRTGAFSTEYRLLITPAGLEHQRLHALGASGEAEMSLLGGYLFNVRHGLTAFNDFEWDNGGMYTNPDNGFVDPLTGILLWIGLGAIVAGWRGGTRPALGDVLLVIGFISLWLALAFLINQAPNYTRMLGVLPFVGYLSAQGLAWLAGVPRKAIGERIEVLSFSLRSAIFVVGLLAIGVLNFGIVGEYIAFGWEDGSIRGATARYVEARKHDRDYSYHLFASQEAPYFIWGEQREWREWIGFFLSEGQQLEIEGPASCRKLEKEPPFTVLTTAAVWRDCAPVLIEEYPNLTIFYTHPNQSRLAIEILDD